MKNMKVNIVNYSNLDSHFDLIEHVCATAAKKLQLNKEDSLTIVLATDDYLHELNRKYRGVDRPTDVLTFPDGTLHHLGDVIISIDRCLAQAKSYNHSFERELSFLVVHGLLHTLGYDHHTKEEEKEMFLMQDEILLESKITR
jgi:probable rRNA maturation factor